MFRTALISLFLTSAALADTWTVDDDGKADFDNIQAAIDAASDGDTVEVQAGTYFETIDFLGKSISVTGVAGSVVTIINAQFAGTAVTISGTDAVTTLAGFTIEKGYTSFGGGLNISNCQDLQFIDCHVSANIATYGGGIHATSCVMTFQDCDITGNTANAGGGVHATSCEMTFRDSFIRNNQTNGGENVGGGLSLYTCTVDMFDTVISGNTAVNNGGGARVEQTPVSMEGGGILGNTSQDSDGGGLYLTYSDLSASGVEFSDNYAYSQGGAMYSTNDPRVNLFGCYGSNNRTSNCENSSSNYQGGTIYLYGNAIATVYDCNFRDGCSGRGGWMYVGGTSVVDIYNTILGGFSSVYSYQGETIYVNSPSTIVFVANSVICGSGSDPIDGGWVDKGGNSFPSSCPEFIDTGSCCLNGLCTSMTYDDCNSIYGIFQGVGLDCADSQCPAVSEPTGACCLDMGQCVATLENDCLAANGSFAGLGVLCADSACPEHCYGDIDGNGTVNIVDVLGVMASWGACP